MWHFKLFGIQVENTNKANANVERGHGITRNTLHPGALINLMLKGASAAINGEVVSEAGGWWIEVKVLASW